VEAGTAVVAGVDCDDIVRITDEILTDQEVYDRMANAINPYGDGHASERIVAVLKERFA
ncbi:MAG: UDP-N-acetylglucosamine 2-epimerase, partial [Eggerthellaceae bacterium]|nr:UDP-N-acetylglucosamine 2-epimerase [Eggerthellaceae bacterium]